MSKNDDLKMPFSLFLFQDSQELQSEPENSLVLSGMGAIDETVHEKTKVAAYKPRGKSISFTKTPPEIAPSIDYSTSLKNWYSSLSFSLPNI